MARAFQMNAHAVEQLWSNPDLSRLLESLADQASDRAETLAPRVSGTYAASFEVRVVRMGDGRPVIRLHNTAPYAAKVEFGGSGSVKHRCLGRALDSLRGQV